MSRADDIRRQLAQPHMRVEMDRASVESRSRTNRAVARRVRKLVGDEPIGPDGELGELALDDLVSRLAALINPDPVNNSALIRELLPAYLTEHARARL